MALFQKPKKIKSPDELMDFFEQYKTWAIDNPWKKRDFIRSGERAGEIVELIIDRPLTEWGFAMFLGMSYQGLRNYGERKDHAEYFDNYMRIKAAMQEQRISGGLAGMYNANLVARIDGIVEKSATEHTGTIKFDSPVKWTLPQNGLEKEPKK